MTGGLEGRFRPGHFEGVATVVAQLFNLVGPDAAYFGLKDYQQYRVIKAMARDLHFPLEVVGCPTARENDGLAMSSRNRYLSPRERRAAPALFKALGLARCLVEKGCPDPARVEKAALEALRQAGGFKPQYLKVVDPETLASVKKIQEKVLVTAAVFLGKTRLIDNLEAQPIQPSKGFKREPHASSHA